MKKLIVFLCLISTPSFACYYNSDCYSSGVCIKGPGQVYGICAAPVNKYGTEDYTKKGLIDPRPSTETDRLPPNPFED
jgi:hypothetical protein